VSKTTPSKSNKAAFFISAGKGTIKREKNKIYFSFSEREYLLAPLSLCKRFAITAKPKVVQIEDNTK